VGVVVLELLDKQHLPHHHQSEDRVVMDFHILYQVFQLTMLVGEVVGSAGRLRSLLADLVVLVVAALVDIIQHLGLHIHHL